MPNIKLSYFDFDGGRGEDARLALFIAGVNFDDDRIKPPNWPAHKASTPFGELPVLTVEGKTGQLAQSTALLTYLGRSYNLHPTDLWEAAPHCHGRDHRHQGPRRKKTRSRRAGQRVDADVGRQPRGPNR
ncbi:MAG: glutathione S-transferase N-terminal domain-containing protein [Nannocystaceae bacterium]